jgi:magnesium transporter
MARLIKGRSRKVGQPPGTLVHIGAKKVEEPKIRIIDYDEEHFQEREIKAIEECFLFREQPTVTWINVDGLHKPEILEKLGECYRFHPLVLEDILNTDQRPKMEDYGDYIYIVLKMLHDRGKAHQVEAEQISLILGPNFVFSFQEREGDVFDAIRERIRNGKGRIRKLGPDYLAYTLLDAIVDYYFVILEELGERLESVEEELVTDPGIRTLQEIHGLKREMIFMRRAIWPLREVIGGLERSESQLIRDTTDLYLRDVYDHVIQVADTIETFRDMTSGILDVYLSSVSNRMNSVMKVLTVIATIFIPLTFLAGVYGMNFKHMPELEWPWAYPAVWAVMTAIALSMVVYFRKKKWF